MMKRLSFLCPTLVFFILSACARLDYNRIGLHENVVKGGQTEIDQGHVVDVNWLPGIWLAGHHTTHGSVFSNLGDARVGDQVCVYSKCYIVFNIIVVSQDYIVTHELAPLVLQTSWYGRVLLVLAR